MITLLAGVYQSEGDLKKSAAILAGGKTETVSGTIFVGCVVVEREV
ncbi:hypothetical protein [Oleiagrimonas sp.]|nr:hypothetical protein [Oleiagrimonas sp.]MDA3912960.1 hypothetical protein [Oleiagrimonas sp.]